MPAGTETKGRPSAVLLKRNSEARSTDWITARRLQRRLSQKLISQEAFSLTFLANPQISSLNEQLILLRSQRARSLTPVKKSVAFALAQNWVWFLLVRRSAATANEGPRLYSLCVGHRNRKTQAGWGAEVPNNSRSPERLYKSLNGFPRAGGLFLLGIFPWVL